ncbi:MAG: PASTA domain-containing protein [Chloroflexota bacterium]|jgi:beta-lactam-binding protein with PASTA domain|nr:PASTA domain-containing protein [Chloroflexota bacterium]MDP6509430.1 PASTA domain-containing protein [Chloroflexota bacterium]
MATTVDPLATLADRYDSHGFRFSLGPVEFHACRRCEDDSPVLAAVLNLTELEPPVVAEVTAAAERWPRAAFADWRPIDIHPVSESLYVVVADDPGGGRPTDDGEAIRPHTAARAVNLGVQAARAAEFLLAAGIAVPAIPPGLLRETLDEGLVILHAWLLPVLPWLLRLGASAAAPAAIAIPPETDTGGPPAPRTAVFAVATLVRRLLEGLPPARRAGVARAAIAPRLERILARATADSLSRRPPGLREFARELTDAGPANRRNFVPAARRPVQRRRRRLLTRPRRLLPDRPVTEVGPPRVKPWMIALVTAAGIIAFLALLPRIGNPLEPVEDILTEFRSAFTDPEEPDADSASADRLLLVPDFTGRQQSEVQLEAARLDLELTVAEEIAPDIAPGSVIRQEPASGARVRGGAALTIVVARGEAEAFLIAVQNRTALDAREALTELGFVVVEVPGYDENRPAGIVLSQSPEPGLVLPKGTQVVIEVSRGARRLAIPSVVGLPEEDASRIITDLGLNVAAEPVTDAPVIRQPGEVVAQQPGAGSSVEPGATVVLRIYAPDAITVPDLTGLDLGQALQAIAAAGLAPGIVQQTPGEADQPLVVIAQSPPSGSPAARNTVIDFQIGPR